MLTVKFSPSLATALYPSLLNTLTQFPVKPGQAVIQKDGSDVALATIGFITMTFREIPAWLSVTEETFGFDPMTFEAFALDMSPDQGEVLLHAIGRCVAGYWNATNLHIGDHGIAIFHENDHGGGRGPDCTMTSFSYDQLRQVASPGIRLQRGRDGSGKRLSGVRDSSQGACRTRGPAQGPGG